MVGVDINDLVTGDKYVVTYEQQSGNGRWYKKRMRAGFLGKDSHGGTMWNLRPEAGTATLSNNVRILEIERVHHNETVVLPHSVKE